MPGPAPQQQKTNVGSQERVVSVAAGSILAALGVSRKSVPGLMIAGVGAAMIYRGASGHCPVYQSLGLDTEHPSSDQGEGQRQEKSQGRIHVEQAFLINRSPEDLYQFWRNFENLPRIMTHLESVRVIDDRRSYWVARPAKVAGQMRWEAEITRDEPNSRIEWRALPGWDLEHSGQVRFAPAMGDRGTEVHIVLDYLPATGQLMQWFGSLFSGIPRRVIREDLRNFKRIMEVGEIPTTIGQPRGTCTGIGTRERE